MFEIAGSLAIARELNMNLKWIWEPSDKRDFGLNAFGLVDEGFRDVEPDCKVVDQGCRNKWEANREFVRNFKGDECVIYSRFQSEECFEGVKDEVRELFAFPKVELTNPAGTTPVAIHVRRGDYVNHLRLWVTAPEYFDRSVAYMRQNVPNPHFIVVSDDPEWCRGHFKGKDFTVMGEQTPIESMQTIASCEAHIISNSTFGWWGAWLGEKGPVCIPSRWFTEIATFGEWNPTPERWVKIECSGARFFRRPLLPPRSGGGRNLVVQRTYKKKP